MNDKHYIEIGHSKIVDVSGEARLTCDIAIDGNIRNIYFGVDKKYKKFLTINRADPFLALMINYGLFTGRDIRCLDPVDEYFLFGLRKQYIKTLCFANPVFHPIEIVAQSTNEPYPNEGKTGAAMSFGCDSLYTFFKHYKKSEYPITHICFFNNGGFDNDATFIHEKTIIENYAIKKELEFVYVDSNIHKASQERNLNVYTQRNLACILALQGLFSTYLYASGHDDTHFLIDPYNAAYYDLLTIETFSTRNLQFILSGAEVTRVEKLRDLLEFEDTSHYLHPCFKSNIDEKNCGHCQKDIREMVLLYAWGKKDEFSEVYNFKSFEKRLPMCLGILIALSNQHLYKEVLVEYTRLGNKIPSSSYRYAEIYSKVLEKKVW